MSRSRDAGGPRALLVGFEEPFALAAAASLRDAGWAVEWTAGGREALSRWPALAPDLLVANLDGGDMDELEFLGAASALAPAPRILACSASAGGGAPDAAALAELGIDALVVLPCRVDELAAAADRLARRAPAREAAAQSA